mmetsp:Transcript_48101/g.148451  ORF Transcript_48101/g.148451 Transcript_48101/m.148451 type:complete len:282 (-) Transcript_48101:327-1172(-)
MSYLSKKDRASPWSMATSETMAGPSCFASPIRTSVASLGAMVSGSIVSAAVPCAHSSMNTYLKSTFLTRPIHDTCAVVDTTTSNCFTHSQLAFWKTLSSLISWGLSSRLRRGQNTGLLMPRSVLKGPCCTSSGATERLKMRHTRMPSVRRKLARTLAAKLLVAHASTRPRRLLTIMSMAATALWVLPVPGGPCSRTPVGSAEPMPACSSSSGCLYGHTTHSVSAVFTSSRPPTVANVSVIVSGSTTPEASCSSSRVSGTVTRPMMRQRFVPTPRKSRIMRR